MKNLTDNRIRLVVIDGHTLAVIRPGSITAEILHASILRGAVFSVWPEPIIHAGRNVRTATMQDFVDFRVCSKGFDNPTEYIYN